MNKLAVTLLLLCQISMVLAKADINNVRVWDSPDSTRVVFDLSAPIEYQLFTLEKPNRVVLDIKQADFKVKLDKQKFDENRVQNIRSSRQANGKMRIVLDVKDKVKPSSFLLTPNQVYGHRLVIDLAQPQKKKNKANVALDLKGASTREFIIAVDPGHGGEDSGAVGRVKKLREKDIVLSVSKKLVTLINKQSGMRAFLVRNGDYYIGLRRRIEIAREHGADLFISVHADSFKDARASGASVFVLSEKGASNEAARWLAESENRADLIGGLRLEDKNDILASVLLDLSQTASKTASHEFASHLIANLAKVTDLHHKTVQRAGFAVLKSPDIPSVLVELGFISNQQGEAKLATAAHQQALANALLQGVKIYFAKKPKPIHHPHEWHLAKNQVTEKNNFKINKKLSK